MSSSDAPPEGRSIVSSTLKEPSDASVTVVALVASAYSPGIFSVRKSVTFRVLEPPQAARERTSASASASAAMRLTWFMKSVSFT